MQYTISFPGGSVVYRFQQMAETLASLYPADNCIIITDSNVASLYKGLLKGYRTIPVPAGEEHKNSFTIAGITETLIAMQAHRKTTLIGIGGGMVTDITGFVAATYMRGLPFAFVPTTLLGMVDAAIGGKNGINFGLHKNLLGTIRQPQSILFDTSFLHTLPDAEWSNGFAEIIKYACLFDAALFDELSRNNIEYYKQNNEALTALINRCVAWKNKIVLADEKESDTRKLLNFGHTAGHALENLYHLPHGYAVALGMVIACKLSENVVNMDSRITNRLTQLLRQYHLPVRLSYDVNAVMELLKMDKKRNTDTIDYILLNDTGQSLIKPLSIDIIERTLTTFADAGSH